MSKDYYFISTNLELDLDNKKKKILAGNWCITNHKDKKLKKKYQTLEDIWKKPSKRKSDYKYLQIILKKYSDRLAFYLNSLHGNQFSKNFWKRIVMAWLTIYLPSQFYRWQIVKNIIKLKKNINFYDLKYSNKPNYLLDTLDYHNSISTNNYHNYAIFKNLMSYYKKKGKKIQFIKRDISSYVSNKSEIKKKDIFYILKLKKIFNYFLHFLFSKNKIFIENNTFSIRDNIKINLLLGQLPTYPNDTFKGGFGYKDFYENKKVNLIKRKAHTLKATKNDEFTSYIDSIIRQDIPICFIEGFNDLYKYAQKIIIKPKIILSSYYHYYNELFKIWSSYLVEKKYSKLFIVSHGAGGFLQYSSCLKFEAEIADKKINWYKSKKLNEIQLPASKFLTKKKIKSTKEFISYVEGPITPFPSKIGDGIINNGSPDLHNNFINLFKKIDVKLKKKIIFLPKTNFNIDSTKYLKNFLKKSQIKKNDNFRRYKNRSKLVILNYPETAFCESLIAGRPTILLYEREKWEFDKKFQSIYKKLIKYKILFHYPQKAAEHINLVSNNINKWWYSKPVSLVVNEFLNQTCFISNDSINIWVNTLKKELKK